MSSSLVLEVIVSNQHIFNHISGSSWTNFRILGSKCFFAVAWIFPRCSQTKTIYQSYIFIIFNTNEYDELMVVCKKKKHQLDFIHSLQKHLMHKQHLHIPHNVITIPHCVNLSRNFFHCSKKTPKPKIKL